MTAKFTPKVWSCTKCGQEFSAPNMDCYPGQRHEVEAKKYYSECDGLCVMWKTDMTFPNPSGIGQPVAIAGKSAQFMKGLFVTSDPEEQEFFDNYKGCIPWQQWEDLHISKEEKLRRQGAALEGAKRVIHEQNTELENLKRKLSEQYKGKTVATA